MSRPRRHIFFGRHALLLCIGCLLLSTLLAVGYYYLSFLPAQAGELITGEQLNSGLITDSSSNGIIEIGFSYPIFVPTLRFTNRELSSRHLNVFLRMVDADDKAVLYRAVRAEMPNQDLTVEATVRGMLDRNREYLFLPVTVPPLRTISGRVAFIISDIEDGTSFTEALTHARQAVFQFRDPATGELLYEFPVTAK
ncbi:MAG: hypothetical protein ACR2PR_08505 [Pseudohongiellaceae bacterium]